VREVADRLDVDDVEHRVRRRFEQHGLGRRRQRLLPLLEVAAVDEFALDSVLRQQVVDDVVARAEQLARGNDAVAALEQREQRVEHCRHAGRGRYARLGALERGKAVLEHRNRRIAEA
jgi:cell division protein FtsB